MTMEVDITEYFPHIDDTKPGEWCADGGIFLNCGDAAIEISVYREPICDDDPETSGTLTLHIFYNDDVLLAKTIERPNAEQQDLHEKQKPINHRPKAEKKGPER